MKPLVYAFYFTQGLRNEETKKNKHTKTRSRYAVTDFILFYCDNMTMLVFYYIFVTLYTNNIYLPKPLNYIYHFSHIISLLLSLTNS